MDAAQELGALDELPEATVVLLAGRDAAGSVVDLVLDYANRRASVVAGVPAGELIGHRVGDATASEAGDVLIAVGEACANAIEHAGAAPGTPIDVRGQLVGREVVLRVRDRGVWR